MTRSCKEMGSGSVELFLSHHTLNMYAIMRCKDPSAVELKSCRKCSLDFILERAYQNILVYLRTRDTPDQRRINMLRFRHADRDGDGKLELSEYGRYVSPEMYVDMEDEQCEEFIMGKICNVSFSIRCLFQ